MRLSLLSDMGDDEIRRREVSGYMAPNRRPRTGGTGNNHVKPHPRRSSNAARRVQHAKMPLHAPVSRGRYPLDSQAMEGTMYKLTFLAASLTAAALVAAPCVAQADQHGKLEAAFKKADKDSDGTLDKEEA